MKKVALCDGGATSNELLPLLKAPAQTDKHEHNYFYLLFIYWGRIKKINHRLCSLIYSSDPLLPLILFYFSTGP